jgi:hypothetical protein
MPTKKRPCCGIELGIDGLIRAELAEAQAERDSLLARCDAYVEEIDNYKTVNKQNGEYIDNCFQEINELKAKLARAREALIEERAIDIQYFDEKDRLFKMDHWRAAGIDIRENCRLASRSQLIPEYPDLGWDEEAAE